MIEDEEPINTAPMVHVSKYTMAALARLEEKIANGLGADVPPSCPFCFGTGMELVPDTDIAPATSKATWRPTDLKGDGARRCRCQADPRIVRSLGIIPVRYKSAVLADLQPRVDRHPKQPEVVAYMKAHPEANYFICGKPNSGKTHLYWSLYQAAAVAGRLVFASKLFDLIEAIKAQIFDSKLPSPLPSMGGSERMGIFLEDVNKARPTEFVGERLFNFLDDVYNNKHQLVVTSQLAPADLVKYFDRGEEIKTVDGAALVRRMANEETTIWRMM